MSTTMNYLNYLQTTWEYIPYLIYTFVFLTLLPKSISRICKFAKADYEANRNKYHRCYGPDLCCHTLIDDDAIPKTKQRKAVTRVYPKKQSTVSAIASAPLESNVVIKRQVQPSSIQTYTKVNKIARMFENSNSSNKDQKKINRVTPTLQINMFSGHNQDEKYKKSLQNNYSKTIIDRDDIENSINLLNRDDLLEELANNSDYWDTSSTITKFQDNIHKTNCLNGTSTTPSTISPAISTASSRPSTPNSPVQMRKSFLNMMSSMEDIFTAIAQNAEENENYLFVGSKTLLSPVTSIDDILSERRLSRPLSAYSISDLLNDENVSNVDETFVENFLHPIKT